MFTKITKLAIDAYRKDPCLDTSDAVGNAIHKERMKQFDRNDVLRERLRARARAGDYKAVEEAREQFGELFAECVLQQEFTPPGGGAICAQAS